MPICSKIQEYDEKIDKKIKESKFSISGLFGKIFGKISDILDSIGILDLMKERPDLIILLLFLIISGVVMFIYFVLPESNMSMGDLGTYIQNALSKFSKADYTIGEVGEVRDEVNALAEHSSYFDSPSNSYKNMGLMEISKMNMFLPILSVLIMILPYLAILYLVWFIWNYWKYVLEAVWGLFKLLIGFVAKFMVCFIAKGIKSIVPWPFRKVIPTPSCPKFSEMFWEWAEKYVIVPMYKERLKMLEGYVKFRERFMVTPYVRFYKVPKEKLSVLLGSGKDIFQRIPTILSGHLGNFGGIGSLEGVVGDFNLSDLKEHSPDSRLGLLLALKSYDLCCNTLNTILVAAAIIGAIVYRVKRGKYNLTSC